MDKADQRYRLFFHLACEVFRHHHYYLQLHQQAILYFDYEGPIYKPECIQRLEKLLVYLENLIIPYWFFDQSAHDDNIPDNNLWVHLPFPNAPSIIPPEYYTPELHQMATIFPIDNEPTLPLPDYSRLFCLTDSDLEEAETV